MKTLFGHDSPETAYVVDDYPYGFRLRCKIRYWLDYRKGYGFRFMSQTTNPKKSGEVWNKPKASTYSNLGVMLLDESNGYISWTSLSFYDLDKLESFVELHGPALEDANHQFELKQLRALKIIREARDKKLAEALTNQATA